MAGVERDKICVPIETLQQWGQICGDNARKDMLYVVEVFAEWCGPSIACLSTYNRLFMEQVQEAKKLRMCKVCADLTKELEDGGDYLGKFRDNPKPTFLLFVNGEQVQQIEGVSMPNLEKAILNYMPEGLLEEEEEAEEEAAPEDDGS